MLFNTLFGDAEEEKKEEKQGPAAPSCYGCVHMVASPMLDCIHPNSVRVLWDPIRNRSYRVPSILLCKEHGGVCKFYEPSPERGVEYSIMKEYEESAKKRESRVSIDDKVDLLMDDLLKDDILDKFMDRLNSKYIKFLGKDEEDVEEEEDEV